jgi:hypothetical protein
VPSDQASLHVSLTARAGDAELHAALTRLATTTRSPAVRTSALAGLSSFRSPELLRRSLDLLLDGSLRAQDYRSIVSEPIADERTHALVWQWLVESEPRLVEVLGARMAEQLPWVVAGACTPEAREAGRQHFAASTHLGPGAQHNLDQALETAARCIELRRRHAASIAARLASTSG